jgi:putative membrane protein
MLSLSDRLAISRTHLANERTLLAYVRTALALAAGGVGLVQIFTAAAVVVLGWALIPTSALVLLMGVARFQRTRRTLRTVEADAGRTDASAPST